MATDFTQDTLLHFLQSHGGQVKNSDLLLHFKNFIRDNADRNRNRELFKKFVNTLATVKQIDGVSYVVLRKKYKGHVVGGGEGGSSEPPRRNTEPSAESAKLSPAWSAEKPRHNAAQRREVTAPAPPGGPDGKTILPAAGIMLLNNNNNNVETNLNLKRKQVMSTPELPVRPAAAQLVSQTPSRTQAPAPDQSTKVGQHRAGLGLPAGITSVVTPHVETRQQVPVPEPRRGRQPADGGLHQEPPLHQLQGAPRRIRHRKSYKSAVSQDEDEEEEDQMSRGSTGGAWPLSTPLGDTERAISASSPCIVDLPVVASPSSSERKLPQIYVQDVEGKTMFPGGPGRSLESGVGLRGQRAGPGLEAGTIPEHPPSTRRSLPLEAERYVPSSPRATHHYVHADRRHSQPAGVLLDQGLNQSHGSRLPSSHSSIDSPSSDPGLSTSDLQLSSSPRGSGWNSRLEDLQARAGHPGSRSQIQEVLQRAQGKKAEKESVMHHANSKTTPWHHSTGDLHDDQEPSARLAPLHRSTEQLHADQRSTARVMPWHLSTGDLHDDRGDAESSDGSTSSPPLRLRPPVARRLSSQLRSRMCRSLGTDLDQLLQEEVRAGGGSEAARLNRLHMISSSLSLRYNLSSSSLSSCSTPPRCQSFTDLNEGVEGGGGLGSFPAPASSPAHHEGPSRQSLVPLEPREHAWLVKGAAGAWPDIYTLFREDSSLLNRQDFISGFTVLHWIAKHGDHRVLNTLWYGVQKAGLTFDIDAKSTCGHTPLHIAAMHGNKNMMRLLVNKFNADVKLRDTAGKKPWQYLSRAAPPEVFQLLGAPPRFTGKGEGEVGGEDPSLEPRQQHRRRRRHHLSFASSGERPLTMTGTTRVKRSSSIAAFLKHKSMLRFHGHQSDTSF